MLEEMLKTRDVVVALCIVGVAAWSLNWYVYPKRRGLLLWLAIVVIVILGLVGVNQ